MRAWAGVGGQLLDALVDAARELSAHKVELKVWPHNDAALRLYLSWDSPSRAASGRTTAPARGTSSTYSQTCLHPSRGTESPDIPGGSSAVHCDGKGSADLAHPRVRQATEPLDEDSD